MSQGTNNVGSNGNARGPHAPSSPVDRSMASNLILRAIAAVAVFSLGLFNWCIYLTIAILQGAFLHRPSEQEGLKIKLARDKFWNLAGEPIPGFRHAFLKLRSGFKLHYITNRPNAATAATPTDLVVFVHGFPDSCVMWRHVLEDPGLTQVKQAAAIVCVDLPGYGGSDSIPKYDPSMLEALTEFILAMREKHVYNKKGERQGKSYVLGHDWGCILTYRLAADAPQLADRFVVSNGTIVEHMKANKDRVLQSSYKIFKQFQRSPIRNFGCLIKAFKTLQPLLGQVMLSGYIFAFHLPRIMVEYLGSGGNGFFFRAVLAREHGKTGMGDYKYEESVAAALGPGVEECSSSLTATSESYGSSLLPRAKSQGCAFWHMTGLYRDGAGLKTWHKSLEIIAELHGIDTEPLTPNSPSGARRSSSSASSTLFSEQYKGSLRAPTTVLWGEDDLAIGRAIGLDGIGDYLAKGSEVIMLPRSGHWTAVEPESRKAWVRVINSLIVTESKTARDLPIYLCDRVKEVYEDAWVLVKR